MAAYMETKNPEGKASFQSLQWVVQATYVIFLQEVGADSFNPPTGPEVSRHLREDKVLSISV